MVKYHRSTCGKWRIVKGRRSTCNYPRGHEGDCKPVKRLKELEAAARREELIRLAAEHDLSECEQCRAYVRAVEGGADPAAPETTDLRCLWASSVHRELMPGGFR